MYQIEIATNPVLDAKITGSLKVVGTYVEEFALVEKSRKVVSKTAEKIVMNIELLEGKEGMFAKYVFTIILNSNEIIITRENYEGKFAFKATTCK